MYYELFAQMKKMLAQLDTWLETAASYAQARSFDPNVFLGLRLAPDQFAFKQPFPATRSHCAKQRASRGLRIESHAS